MELELKFALALADPSLLERQLARVPLIGRRTPRRQALHSTYYDTPEHTLQQQRVALRVRQMDGASQPQWVQTLKMGGTADSAFSRRGEWEQPLQTDALSRDMLADTPWTAMDPHGTLYAALAPVFTTTFERLSWTVAVGGASVEIALDRGSVWMDGHSTPLCELEIELLSGAPEALFEAATQISQQLCLLPLHMSKAERAYRLAQGTLDAPLRAKAPELNEAMALGEVAQAVLRASFLQFTANLYTLCNSDAPEVLHQARVGWRRFKCALKIFRLWGEESGLPALDALKALLAHMTALRDLDVAASEVFPTHAAAYQAGDLARQAEWQQLEDALAQEMHQVRSALLQALAEPAVGRTLLQLTHWLEMQASHAVRPRRGHKPTSPGQWLRKRVERLADQLQAAQRLAVDAQAQHRMRLLSKRLRYGVEDLRPLLPAKRARHWYRTATQLQTQVGLARDLHQAIDTAERLHAPHNIVWFLRGAAFGSGLG